jgi:hypothetical protein
MQGQAEMPDGGSRSDVVRRVALRCTLIALSALLTLMLLEFLVRIVGPRESMVPPDGGVTVRADAFRQPLPGPKEGEFRIVALGDSHTWGHGVSDGRLVWPALLEGRLAGAAGARRIQVVNLGVPGFTTVNELEMLSRNGVGLEPDLIIVQYLLNDVLPSDIGYRRKGEEWLYPREIVPLVSSRRVHRWLFAHSGLYRLVDRRFEALQRMIWPPRRYEDLYVEGFAGWRDMRRAIAGIARIASDRGIPAVYMLFPGLVQGSWTNATHPQAEINTMVGSFAREQGLFVLDLLPAFVAAGRPFEQWWVDPNDAHPGPEAYALVARTLGDFLQESGLIDPRTAAGVAPRGRKSGPGDFGRGVMAPAAR